MPILIRVFHRSLTDFYGAATLLKIDRELLLLSKGLELLYRSRSDHIRGNEKGFSTLFCSQFREFPSGGRFSGPLQTHHHDDGRILSCRGDRVVDRAHQVNEFIMNNLDDLLGGVDVFDDILSHRFLTDVLDEVLYDLEVYIGAEKRHANFAQTLGDILLAQSAFARHLAEDACEGFGQ